MEQRIVIFLSLFVLVQSELWSDDARYVYSYCGSITLGSKLETDFKTYSKICADLELSKTNDGDIWMKFSNVTYRAYASQADISDLKDVPIEDDSKFIETPFCYHKYADVKKSGITTISTDKEWSKDIKQGIANLFYLNLDVLNETKDLDRDFKYNIIRNDKDIRVFRTKKDKIVKNNKEFPKMSTQEYFIEDNDGKRLIKSVQSVSSIHFTPFETRGVNFYVYVNQNLELKFADSNPIVKPEVEMKYEDFWRFNDVNVLNEYGMLKLYKDRREIDLENMKSTVENDLQKLYTQMNDYTIEAKVDLIDEKYEADDIIRRLRILDTEQIKELLKSTKNFSNKYLEKVLLQMVSLTGNLLHANHIIDLIVENEISKDDSIVLLKYISKSLIERHDSIQTIELYEDTLKKIFEIVKNEEIDWDIKKSIILLLSKFVNPSGETEERISNYFVKKFFHLYFKQKAPVEEDIYKLYISAINNFKDSDHKNQILTEIIYLNNLPDDVKAYAIYSIDYNLDYEQKMYQILLDRKNTLQVRAAALTVLLNPKYPENFEKIHLLKLQDDDLKNLFWTRMKSYASTTIPQIEKAKVSAKKLLPFIESVNNNPLLSSTRMFDYTEPETGNGAGFVVTHYGIPEIHNFITFRIESFTRSIDSSWNHKLFHVDLRWTNKSEAAHYKTIKDISSLKFKDVNIDFIRVENGVVQFIKRLDPTKLNVMSVLLDHLSSLNYVDQPIHHETVLHTEMGIPVVFFVKNTVFVKGEFDISIENEALNLEHDCDKHEYMGFMTFNPVSNIQHVVRKINVLKARIPLHFKVPDHTFQSARLVFDLSDKPYGIKTYTYGEIDMWDENDGKTIMASCDTCAEQNGIVENPLEIIDKVVIWEDDGKNTGINCQFSGFSLESELPENYKYRLFNMIFDSKTKNYGDSLGARLFLSIFKFRDMLTVPVDMMYGVGFICQKNQNVTHIEIEPDMSEFREKNSQDTARTIISYFVKNEDVTVHEIDLQLRLNDSETYSDQSIIVKDSKGQSMCLESTKIWHGDYVEFKHDLSIGASTSDNDCSDVNLQMKGKTDLTYDQPKELGKKFDECLTIRRLPISECLIEMKRYNKFEFDLEMLKHSDDLSEFLTMISDYMRSVHSSNYITKFDVDTTIKPNTKRIVYKRVPDVDGIDIEVSTNKNKHLYKDILWKEFLYPKYMNEFNDFTRIGRDEQYRYYCEATVNYLKQIEDGQKYALKVEDEDWTILSKYCIDEKCLHVIKIKRVSKESDVLVLRLNTENDFAEVYFGEDLDVVVNGKTVLLENEDYHKGNEIGYNILKSGNKNRILFNIKDSSIIAYYDKNRVRLLKTDQFTDGNCSRDSDLEIFN